MEFKGVDVTLEELVYTRISNEFVEGRPHAFAYTMRIENRSDHTVTLNARKWVLEYEDGRREVYEGDRIVGEIVELEPGERFDYNSYHLVDADCVVHGAYHGYMDEDVKIWVRIPKFHLHIPENLS